jgi:hypothetical protein
MGYEDDMVDTQYESALKLEWKIHIMLQRAKQIAREWRIKLGEQHVCHAFDIQCDCEMPEFQEVLHPAHSFNKYLMEQRIRYGVEQ